MRYELTQDLLTGNQLIDSEHRQLFDAINALMDACAQGAGRTKINETVQFLNSYVSKHFRDEEQLQLQSKYPGYNAHHTFHEGYKRELAAAANPDRRGGAQCEIPAYPQHSGGHTDYTYPHRGQAGCPPR